MHVFHVSSDGGLDLWPRSAGPAIQKLHQFLSWALRYNFFCFYWNKGNQNQPALHICNATSYGWKGNIPGSFLSSGGQKSHRGSVDASTQYLARNLPPPIRTRTQDQENYVQPQFQQRNAEQPSCRKKMNTNSVKSSRARTQQHDRNQKSLCNVQSCIRQHTQDVENQWDVSKPCRRKM